MKRDPWAPSRLIDLEDDRVLTNREAARVAGMGPVEFDRLVSVGLGPITKWKSDVRRWALGAKVKVGA